jgi:phosphatidylinositol alpha-1,6-mannosyltransferase
MSMPSACSPTWIVRVLVLTPDFPPSPGGIQRLVQRLASSWHDVDARVLTSAHTGHSPREPAQRWSVRSVGTRGPFGRRSRLAILNVMALLETRRFRPDIVLSCHAVTAPAAWTLSRVLGLPYLQYVYGKEVVHRPHLSRFAVRHAAGVIAISRYTCSLIEPWIDPKALHLIPPGVDLPPFHGRRSASRPTIITVGRLVDRYKGHDVMMQALPVLARRIPNIEWVVVGDGPLRPTYERMMRQLNLGGSVRFLGALDDAARDQWLDQAHVFALPARLSPSGAGEGFGIVYLEAGAHHLPVVAGKLAGAVDAVIDGVTGVLVDPSSPDAVADALAGLLLDPVHARSLGDAGAAHAGEFAWPAVARRVELLMQRVVSRAA